MRRQPTNAGDALYGGSARPHTGLSLPHDSACTGQRQEQRRRAGETNSTGRPVASQAGRVRAVAGIDKQLLASQSAGSTYDNDQRTYVSNLAQATHFYSTYGYRKANVHEVNRGGAEYVHYELTYDVPTETRWRAFAPLYFKAADRIERDRPYLFTFWREANGNVTDIPTVLPITVVGPVNGRQCDRFHLTYNRPTLLHSGGFGTFSVAERKVMADTLVLAPGGIHQSRRLRLLPGQ